MPNLAATPQKSPLDFIAEAFWDDFVQGRPIEGGVWLEASLRACQLDDSLASLQRIDTFLEQVHAQNTKRPDLFMQEAPRENLVLFIGFYMGRVLAKAWQTPAAWLGQASLMSRYPHLALHPNNPFHFMALAYSTPQGVSEEIAPPTPAPPSSSSYSSRDRLFFVLEPIALKIFANKIKMPPVIGERIEPSVFAAVVARLPAHQQAAVLRHPASATDLAAVTGTMAITNTAPANAANRVPSAALPVTVTTSELIIAPNVNVPNVDLPNVNVPPMAQAILSPNSSQNALLLPQGEANFDLTNRADATPSQQAVSTVATVSSINGSEQFGQTAPDIDIMAASSSAAYAQPTVASLQYQMTLDIDISATPVSLLTKATKATPMAQTLQMPQVTETIEKIETIQATQLPKKPVQPPKQVDAFKELRRELDTLTVEQDTQNAELAAMYERAAKVLKQVDKVLAADAHSDSDAHKSSSQRQNDNEAQITDERLPLPDEAEKISKQARAIIKKAASQGYTAAMLRLAMDYFLGEGVAQDKQQGFEWVQKAAKAGDIRGMRQMSRLYYQGLGCEQSMELGRYWLEQAAKHGHLEAAELLDSWSSAQTLMDEQKFEATIDQRYLIIIAVVVFIAIVIIILM